MMNIYKSFLTLLEGKDYQRLSNSQKHELRNIEYKQKRNSYLFVCLIFLFIAVVLFALLATRTIKLISGDYSYYLTSIAIISVLLMIFIYLLYMQKQNKDSFIKNFKLDLLINISLIVCVSIITIRDIALTGQLTFYDVGLITFTFLSRIRPRVTVVYLTSIMIAIIIFISSAAISSAQRTSLFINVITLNFVTFFVARQLFIDSVKKYTQRKTIIEQNKELEQLTIMDPMTNIHNRRRFSQRIEEPLITPAAICLFDMDGLKLINDALGHIKGDTSIKLTVEAIKKIFKGDFYARIGGDEFVVLIEDTTEEDVIDKIEKFQTYMEKIDALEIRIDVSAGYAMIDNASEIMNAYKLAENIMYHIKLGARPSRKKRSMEQLLSALHDKTNESLMHCQRVGYISQLISKKMGFNRKNEQESMKLVGLMHDIGMLSIPQDILNKNGPLTKDERTILQLHSEESFKIVCGLIDDKDIENSILYHHERWDGNGYPYQLCGKEIPIFARIFSVADAYDAMTAHRRFQKMMTHEEACEEIKRCSGSQFDPQVVEAFLKIPYTDLE